MIKIDLPLKIQEDLSRVNEFVYFATRNTIHKNTDIFGNVNYSAALRKNNINENDIDIEGFGTKYENNLQKYRDKISESYFVRKYIKNYLKKKNIINYSVADAIRRTSDIIHSIVATTNELVYYNLFFEGYIDIFTESISSENLEKEFEMLLDAYVIDSLKKKVIFDVDNYIMILMAYSEFHAQYIFELLNGTHNEKKCSEIKLSIHEYFNSLDKNLKEQKEELIKVTEKEAKEQKLAEETIMTEFMHFVEQIIPKETLKKIINEENDDDDASYTNNQYNLIRNLFVKNFNGNTEQLDYFIQGFNKITENGKHNENIVKFLHYIYSNEIIVECKERCFFDTQKPFASEPHYLNDALEYLFLLAVLINDGSNNAKITDIFISIYEEIEQKIKLFEDLTLRIIESPIKMTNLISPSDYQNVFKIACVLSDVDNKKTAKLIKSKLLNYSKELLTESRKNAPVNVEYSEANIVSNLDEFNLFDSQLFDLLDDEEIFPHLQEMAINFVLNYIKDKRLLIGTTLYYWMADFISFVTVENTISEDIHMDLLKKEINDNSELIKLGQDLDDIIDAFRDKKIGANAYYDEELNYYSIACRTLGLVPFIYHNYSDYYSDYYKNRFLIIAFISEYMKTDEGKCFFEKEIEEKAKIILNADIFLNLIHSNRVSMNIYASSLKSELYVKAVDIESKKTQETLDKISEFKNKYELEMKKNNQLQSTMNEKIQAEAKSIRLTYQNEITVLKNENKQKDEELKKLIAEKEELNRLRELMFSLQFEEVVNNESGIELTNVIENKSIVIFGGHTSVQSKIKDKYPSIRFINTENGINEQILKTADYIFFMYKQMNHGMYYKAMSIIPVYSIKFGYLRYTNLEKIEKEIYDALKV